MKAVLLSIKPKYCELIANGKKTLEIRKTKPKLKPPFKCLIYCTKPKHPHEDYITIEPQCSYEDFVSLDSEAKKAQVCRAFYGGGKVIGEFVCDSVEEFESEFYNDDTVMNGIYRVVEDEDYPGERILTRIASNEEDSENFWICTQSCLSFDEIKEYVGYDKSEKTFYGWHISDLKIYDKPKELSEFKKPGGKQCVSDNGRCCKYLQAAPDDDPNDENTLSCIYGGTNCPFEHLNRPPQSWCYVEELSNG